MPRYLVTGCAGFIGSTLVETLLDEAPTSSASTRSPTTTRVIARRRRSRPLASRGFELVERDLGAGPLPEPLLEGVDGIFHLAARPGVRASWGAGFPAYLNDNLAATHAIVEAAAARGLPVVFASSSSIYGDALSYPTPEDTVPAPISPYGVTKLACEHLIAAYSRDFGLRCTALRYFTVYGPRQRPDMAFQRIVEALAAGSEFEVYGDGSQSRDFTFVADAVAATIAAMDARPWGPDLQRGRRQRGHDSRRRRHARGAHRPLAPDPVRATRRRRRSPHPGGHDQHPQRARVGAAVRSPRRAGRAARGCRRARVVGGLATPPQ